MTGSTGLAVNGGRIANPSSEHRRRVYRNQIVYSRLARMRGMYGHSPHRAGRTLISPHSPTSCPAVAYWQGQARKASARIAARRMCVMLMTSGGMLGQSWHDHSADLERGRGAGHWARLDSDSGSGVYQRETTGWRATCECDAAVVPAIVLDPFIGSGTTCAVAQSLGRRSVGVDLQRRLSAYRRGAPASREYADAPRVTLFPMPCACADFTCDNCCATNRGVA